WQEQQDLQRAIDEHAIVSATDTGGRIISLNRHFEIMSGYREQELLGQNHRILKSEIHPPEFYRELWQTISSGRVWHGEIKNLSRSGEAYWVKATIVPFTDPQGRPRKYLSIRTDITRMKALETEMTDARDRAEAGARAKSEFLANMSHEIRTPMNAIIGLSHLCLQTQLTPKQQDYIEKVHHSATALLRIINDILDFSKIDAGQLELEITPFSLEDVLVNLSTLIFLKAEEKGVELILDTAVDIPPRLLGDPLRLSQILINLANNAVKFTEAGEVTIRSKMVRQEGEQIWLHFAVEDSGIGMTPEQKSRLFTAFSQADSSISRKYGGTGLGLTISARLIELMGGEIKVESEAGKGSCFSFTLPLEEVSAPVNTESKQHRHLLAGKRVLVVDDNVSARSVIRGYITALGASVSEAENGKESLLRIQEAELIEQPFQLVIMDYMMPELDGIRAIRMIRDKLDLKSPPQIIMATAYGEDSVVRREGKPVGISGYLVKPINQNQLLETLIALYAEGSQQLESGHQERKEQEAMDQLAGAHLLLVEDNEINQQLAQELLQQAHITIAIANHGEEALQLLEDEQFDGILMDMQMPVMDGLTATRHIRKIDSLQQIPILAMTANAMAVDRQLCLEAGMNDHISKPIEPHRLFQTLAAWITPRQPQPPAPPSGSSAPSPQSSGDIETLEQLSTLPGLSATEGLQRVMGKPDAYLKLLRRFCDNQEGALTRLRSALQQGDRESAERAAHTLKGVAATIGAHPLQQSAATLEQALQPLEGAASTPLPPEIETLISEGESQLEQLITALRPLLEQNRIAATTTTAGEALLTAAQLQPHLDEIAHLLSQFDAQVEEKITALLAQPLDEQWRLGITRVNALVASYDFEGAAEALNQMMAEMLTP
ncbi:MAG: response regulator, partial [Gammaproteobacteria bacterium]|nr:response regulator [Gammaproteobacteria bacterium]